MPKWDVYGTVVAGTYVGEVEAETEEEATEKGWALHPGVSVCYHRAEHVSDPEVTEISVNRVPEGE